jgi:hypothetical protein
MTERDALQMGVWTHFRGGRYLVTGIGRLDEDDDEVVIYSRLYQRDEGGLPITVRRLDDFLAPVVWPSGEVAPRFRFLGLAEPAKMTGLN